MNVRRELLQRLILALRDRLMRPSRAAWRTALLALLLVVGPMPVLPSATAQASMASTWPENPTVDEGQLIRLNVGLVMSRETVIVHWPDGVVDTRPVMDHSPWVPAAQPWSSSRQATQQMTGTVTYELRVGPDDARPGDNTDGWRVTVSGSVPLVVKNVTPTIARATITKDTKKPGRVTVEGDIDDPGPYDTVEVSPDWSDAANDDTIRGARSPTAATSGASTATGSHQS